MTDPPINITPSTAKTEKDDPINTALTPIDPSNYYGRQQLVSEGDQDVLNAYDQIASCVANYQTEITFAANGINITLAQLQRAYTYYHDDYPQHFWLDASGYMYTPCQSGKMASITVKYFFNGEATQLNNARAQVNAKLATILSGVTGNMSQYNREMMIHDRLVKLIEYDASKDHIHDMYGTLVNGIAVCEGYARTFQYLMYQAGIQCMIAKGNSHNVGHAWNIVQIDNAYYQMDVTWDDPTITRDDPAYVKDVNLIVYSYYNSTNTQMSLDHTFGYDYSSVTPTYQISYSLPTCTATAANYFVKNGLVRSSFSVNEVATIIANAANNGSDYAYFRLDSKSAFTSFGTLLSNNLNSIASAANSKISNSTNHMTGLSSMSDDKLYIYTIKFKNIS